MTTRRRVTICAALAVALTAHGVSVSAQQPTYKYTTPMPPGIASPNAVETRFGALHFFDGFPDKPSIEKLYDNLDFQRAVQGYLLARTSFFRIDKAMSSLLFVASAGRFTGYDPG